MKSDGYLVPPSSSSAEAKDTSNMWHETWKRVDRFLPGMRKEIFSESPPQSKARPRQSTEKEAERPPPPPPASAAEDPQHASA